MTSSIGPAVSLPRWVAAPLEMASAIAAASRAVAVRRMRGWSVRRATVGDDGQISILVIGYVVVCFGLIAVVVNATAVHLARTQLLDIADGAALDAADTLAGPGLYTSPLRATVPVTDAGVRAEAARYLARVPPPRRVDAIRLGPRTGTDDGRSATVQLSGRVQLPIAAWVVDDFAGGITVTVQATARGDIDR
ncbi:MAG: pilus assembly protein TadG-related protein [Angustibacter sp.]